MQIWLKRAYDEPDKNDGFRVLVDRIWPRGISREELKLDAWLKEISPSGDLRKWFGHDPQKWDEFKRRYFMELKERKDPVEELQVRIKQGRVTLVYAAHDQEHNNAVALQRIS